MDINKNEQVIVYVTLCVSNLAQNQKLVRRPYKRSIYQFFESK